MSIVRANTSQHLKLYLYTPGTWCTTNCHSQHCLDVPPIPLISNIAFTRSWHGEEARQHTASSLIWGQSVRRRQDLLSFWQRLLMNHRVSNINVCCKLNLACEKSRLHSKVAQLERKLLARESLLAKQGKQLLRPSCGGGLVVREEPVAKQIGSRRTGFDAFQLRSCSRPLQFTQNLAIEKRRVTE